MLRLSHAVNFTDSIHPACLSTFIPADFKLCIIAGWGRTTERGDKSLLLRDAAVPIIPHFVCNNRRHYYRLVHLPSMMCAGYSDGDIDACQGDSGGPLVCQLANQNRWELSGVISWGFGCARPRRPGVYTKMLPVVGWMRTQIILDSNANN